jgi:cell shape-determining protein MreC
MDLSQLTPDQKRQVMIQAQMEANQSLRQALMEKMTKSCFEKCAGTSVSFYIANELRRQVLLEL